MTKYFTLLVVVLFIFACSNPGSKTETSQPNLVNAEPKASTSSEPAVQYEIANIVEQEKQEVLDFDSVWLNDAIGFSTTQEEVLSKLGEPDSITTPDFECGAYVAGEEPWGDTVRVWHYQGTKIVTFRNKAEIMVVALRGWDCTLNHPGFIFSGYTTMEELAKVYPKSVEKAYEWTDVRDGQTYQLVRIAPKPSWDDEWVLRFYEGRLLEIEYWTPC